MKKVLLTSVLAVAFVAFAQAQNTTNTQQPCCNRESSVQLDVDIASILCLYPECDQYGFVDFDCRDDFGAVRNFRQNNNSVDFPFGIWSNRRFKVSVTADNANFTRTGPVYPGVYNAFPAANVEWRVAGSAYLVGSGAPLVNGTHYNNAIWKTLGTTDASGDNAINDGPNGIHSFWLNFRTKATLLHPPTTYMPGDYDLEVDITAAID